MRRRLAHPCQVLSVQGIGDHKARRFGPAIFEHIMGFIERHPQVTSP